MVKMGPILLNLAVGLIKGGKANVTNLAITGMAFGVLWYFGTQMVRAGDDKNAMEIKQCRENMAKQQIETLVTLQQINGSLSHLTDSLKDVKKTVETTDKRLWEVRKDVYTIKNRRKDNG
jgi:uncharacterized protein HemX